MKIVITGAKGLLGWHAHCRLYAANCAARFKGDAQPYIIAAIDRETFNSDTGLEEALIDADAVLHFAGVNRANDVVLEKENPAISNRLIAACRNTKSKPHIVYANSTHSRVDNTYGRSKKAAGELLEASGFAYTNLILPHIFGECARANYNNVTATLIEHILEGSSPEINPDGKVQLLHAGEATQIAIDAVLNNLTGVINPPSQPMSIQDLYDKLRGDHDLYSANIYPGFKNDFEVALFNSYRAAIAAKDWPRNLKLNSDARGTLFEAVKGGGGGQTFLSTTLPGVTRGDHFHLNKVERFLVVQGDAIIRIRRVLGGEVNEYRISGSEPAYVDMPTFHTHSIENVGDGPLLTLFWTHDLFDPNNPDTFADPVLT